MSPKKVGIWDKAVAQTPVAIMDLETTGLNAGIDRVIEVSVVRIDPAQAPQLLVDTLVNPGRPISATEIHGITDADVVDAPRFEEIAGDVARALCGCVIGAYNVYFDVNFLEYELQTSGLSYSPPYVCLMYMRPMLGLGKRCSLEDACKAHGIEHKQPHMAGADALAAAKLWRIYLDAMSKRGVSTFSDLAHLKKYKFLNSFQSEPLVESIIAALRSRRRFKSRRSTTAILDEIKAEEAQSITSHREAIHEYWECLKTVLSDLEISVEEISYLAKKQQELKLPIEQVRSLHGRAFASMIDQSIKDKWLDDSECKKLRRLHDCLSKLGWAPGD